MRQLLRNHAKSLKAGFLTNRPGRHDNLNIEKIVHGSSSTSEFDAVLNLIHVQIKSGHYAQAAQEIKALDNGNLRVADGTPLSIIAADMFTDPIDQEEISIAEAEALIPSYKAWFEQTPDCPLAASAYASLLGSIGYRYRGTGWANSVSKEGWQKLENYAKAGRAVFDASHSRHNQNGFWSLKYLYYANTEGCEPSEIINRYRAARGKLPMTPSIHSYIAYMLLPRWHGDYEVLESFIDEVAKIHSNHYGQALYARTYMRVLEAEDVNDLHMDRVRFATGCKDWLKHFPSQYYQTEMAAAAYLAHDYNLTLDLLEDLKDFHFEAFETGESLEMVNSVCREFTDR